MEQNITKIPKKRGPKGPRGINVVKRATKIKSDIDEMINAILSEKQSSASGKPKSFKLSEINFENEDLSTLLEVQAKLSRVILDRSKRK